MTRIVAKLALSVAIVSAALSSAALSLVVINATNPMLLIFLKPVEVYNPTSETLFVTLVSRPSPEGKPEVAPQFSSLIPAFPVWRQMNLAVAAGESRTFIADTDDVFPSEFVVHDGSVSSARVLVLPHDGFGWTLDYDAPIRASLANWRALPPVPPEVMRAASGRDRGPWIWGLVLAGFLTIPAAILYAQARRSSRIAVTAQP